MTRRDRRILFLSLVVFFIIFSPLAVFYSQGYRFDFQSWKVFKIGGLFLDIKTSGAKIFINGKLQAESGGLLYSGSFFKLLPKTYKILISRENYSDWQKTLSVKPNIITQALDVMLFPKNQTPGRIPAEPVDFFALSPDRSKILFAAIKKSTATSSPALSARLADTGGQTVADFLPLALKWPVNSIEILEMRWFGSNADFLLKIEAAKTVRWVLGSKNFGLPTPTPTIPTRRLVLIDDEITRAFGVASQASQITPSKITLGEIFPHPLNQKELIFQSGVNIYTFDFEKKIIQKMGLGSASAKPLDSFLIKNANIWWFDKTGTLAKKDLNVDLIREMAKIPAFSATSSFEFASWGGAFGVQTPKRQYLYNERSGDFLEFKQPITLALFSPDSKKLAYLRNNEVRVRYLEEIKTGDVKKAGDEDVIFSGDIKNIFWLPDSSHLILATADAIKVVELDSRPERNVAELVKVTPQITFYNPDNEKIYFLDGNGFLKTASVK